MRLILQNNAIYLKTAPPERIHDRTMLNAKLSSFYTLMFKGRQQYFRNLNKINNIFKKTSNFQEIFIFQKFWMINICKLLKADVSWSVNKKPKSNKSSKVWQRHQLSLQNHDISYFVLL